MVSVSFDRLSEIDMDAAVCSMGCATDSSFRGTPNLLDIQMKIRFVPKTIIL